MLENVFARELGRKHELIWLFQGDVSKGKRQKWHNTEVLLSREIRGNHWFSKLMNKILKWQKLFQLLCFLWRDDIRIVLIRDLPLEALLIAPLRPFFGFRLYFQYSAPQGDMNIGYFKVNNTIRKFWYFCIGCCHNVLIGKVLKTADFVFPITEFHKRELLSLSSGKKLVPITMGVDEEWLNRDRKEILQLEELKKRHFLISYFGTLNFGRKPQFILNTFAEVRNKCPNSKLILIGKTAFSWEEQELESICRNLGIEKAVIFAGRLDRNKLQDYLSYCDISISAIPPESYYKISSPTKLYESLGNSIPVVANREILEQEKVILESGGGILANYETTSFCNAIVNLLSDRKLREEMGRKGKEYVINNYSYRLIAQKIFPYFL